MLIMVLSDKRELLGIQNKLSLTSRKVTMSDNRKFLIIAYGKMPGQEQEEEFCKVVAAVMEAWYKNGEESLGKSVVLKAGSKVTHFVCLNRSISNQIFLFVFEIDDLAQLIPSLIASRQLGCSYNSTHHYATFFQKPI